MPQRLREVMTEGAETIGPDASLKEAAVKMEVMNIGPLVVCEGDNILGIVTDRDITVRAVASGRDPNTTPVREVMTAEVAWAYADQPIAEAAELMKEREIRRLPVLDHDKRLVGIVSLADVAVHGEETAVAAEVLEKVSQPGEPDRP
jgi:CBS domain-containing protein